MSTYHRSHEFFTIGLIRAHDSFINYRSKGNAPEIIFQFYCHIYMN